MILHRKRTHSRSLSRRIGAGIVAGLTFGSVAVGLALAPPAGAAPYTKGNLFLSEPGGHVEERTPSGALVQTLVSPDSGESAGSTFDAAGNFYVTEFQDNTIQKFSPTGTYLSTFGSGYNLDPESIVIDKDGNLYVGQADGAAAILKFSPTGALLASYSPTTGPRGTDWIDLGADQCTMHYTSEGTMVHAFNVCTNTQLPDFASGLTGSAAFAHRILPDGGELVADSESVVRFDSSGHIVHTYTPSTPEFSLFALNRDPDGVTFWTADLSTGDVYRFNIATGAELSHFSVGGEVGGISLFGELKVVNGGGHSPNLFEVDVRHCNEIHIGYNYFPAGTVIHWHANQTGRGTLGSGSITTTAPNGKTYHFVDLTHTLPLQSGLHTHIYFTWTISGKVTKFVSTRGPACR